MVRRAGLLNQDVRAAVPLRRRVIHQRNTGIAGEKDSRVKRLLVLWFMMMTCAACGAPVDVTNSLSDDDGPEHAVYFDDVGMYGEVDLDAADAIQPKLNSFGLRSVIGMGFRAKSSASGCNSDPRIPGVLFGCDAVKTKILSRFDALQAYQGGYCGQDTATIQNGSYAPCFAPNMFQPDLWKYRLDDSCPGDIRIGARIGISEFNGMMARTNIAWRFREVDSGENITIYCTNSEGQPSNVLASTYFWSNRDIPAATAGNATSNRCGSSGTTFQNNTRKWYNFIYVAMPINLDAMLSEYGTEGRCYDRKPDGVEGWQWLQNNVAGTVIHEFGHVIGLNHYSNSQDGIMRTNAECAAHENFGQTFDSRIITAIKQWDSIYEGGSAPIRSFDADLECIGINGLTP